MSMSFEEICVELEILQEDKANAIAKIEEEIELLDTIIKSWKTKEMKHSHEVAIKQLEWVLKLLKGE